MQKAKRGGGVGQRCMHIAYCSYVCLIDTDGTEQTRTHSGTLATFT